MINTATGGGNLLTQGFDFERARTLNRRTLGNTPVSLMESVVLSYDALDRLVGSAAGVGHGVGTASAPSYD